MQKINSFPVTLIAAVALLNLSAYGMSVEQEINTVSNFVRNYSTYRALHALPQAAALSVAAEHGYAQAAAHYLRQGANPNGQDANGNTPLMRATFWGHANVVDVLLWHGATHKLDNALTVARTSNIRTKLIVAKIIADKRALALACASSVRTKSTAGAKALQTPLHVQVPAAPTYADAVLAGTAKQHKNLFGSTENITPPSSRIRFVAPSTLNTNLQRRF